MFKCAEHLNELFPRFPFMSRSYFDHNATTPLAPQVAEVLVHTMAGIYGNPSSIHREGQAARHALESARRSIARTVGANATEIVLTSGGTESDNLAIWGLVRSRPATRKHVVTTGIEHPAVLETCRRMSQEGVEITVVAPDRNGVVRAEAVADAIRPETVLVSVMHANNEVGSVQPIRDISNVVRALREQGQQLYLHSDGVQAAGRIKVDIPNLGVDLYSLSGHKVYGPKGTGALFVRKGVPLGALQFGGRHERERRAGTENVAGAVAFSRALELASDEANYSRLAQLRDRFEHQVLSGLSDVEINARDAHRLPNTSNIFFDGVEGEALVIALDLKGFAVSSGSACSSGSVEPSQVLLAMGRSRDQARQCVRFSFGITNTEEETDALVDATIQSVRQLRAAHARNSAPKERDFVRV
jgi:cysteine desulfurase